MPALRWMPAARCAFECTLRHDPPQPLAVHAEQLAMRAHASQLCSKPQAVQEPAKALVHFHGDTTSELLASSWRHDCARARKIERAAERAGEMDRIAARLVAREPLDAAARALAFYKRGCGPAAQSEDTSGLRAAIASSSPSSRPTSRPTSLVPSEDRLCHHVAVRAAEEGSDGVGATVGHVGHLGQVAETLGSPPERSGSHARHVPSPRHFATSLRLPRHCLRFQPP